jgi:hypothetical protein
MISTRFVIRLRGQRMSDTLNGAEKNGFQLFTGSVKIAACRHPNTPE